VSDDAELEDIPGTIVFTGHQVRRSYHLNLFCMSLRHAENRARFLADERGHLDEWPMTEAQLPGRATPTDRTTHGATLGGGDEPPPF
jgi:protocatechuate 4,5-dioxygenase alpha subunit